MLALDSRVLSPDETLGAGAGSVDAVDFCRMYCFLNFGAFRIPFGIFSIIFFLFCLIGDLCTGILVHKYY